MHARRQGAPALPLAADHQVALLRPPHAEGFRDRRRGCRPDALRGLLQGGEAMIGRLRIGLGAGALVLALSGLLAPAASATFHEMYIREVYPGSVAAAESEFVEI